MSYEQHLRRQDSSDYPEQLISYLSERFYLKGSVCDWGCGLGGYTVVWLTNHRIKKVLGIDNLPAPSRFIKHLQADICSKIELDHKYDVVFSKSVIEHLNDPTQFLKNMRTCVGEEGTMIVMCPDWKTGMSVFYDDYTHVRPYTQESLQDLLLTIDQSFVVERFWQVPFSWKFPMVFSVFRWIRWILPSGDLRRRMTHAALLGWVRVE